MEKMKKEDLKRIAFLCAIIAFLGILIIFSINTGYQDNNNPVYDACCNGSYCSGTIFDAKTNTCVLTFCRSLGVLVKQSDCYYNAKVGGK